jgi:hypothetical protein
MNAVKRANADQSSGNGTLPRAKLLFGKNVRNRAVSRSSSVAMIATGIAARNVPVMPYVASAKVANTGPVAKPRFPPTANQRIPEALREPEARLAKRAASGWNIATPRPLISAQTKISA